MTKLFVVVVAGISFFLFFLIFSYSPFVVFLILLLLFSYVHSYTFTLYPFLVLQSIVHPHPQLFFLLLFFHYLLLTLTSPHHHPQPVTTLPLLPPHLYLLINLLHQAHIPPAHCKITLHYNSRLYPNTHKVPKTQQPQYLFLYSPYSTFLPPLITLSY
jgi:hypothetical protein